MTITSYTVTGMTCAHCVSAVTEEIAALPGVDSVDIDLVAGGASTVRVSSSETPTDAQIREAVDEAGYTLVETNR